MKILPGLSFSWRRAVGLTALKMRLARRVGVPLTRGGVERKIGRSFLNIFKRRAS